MIFELIADVAGEFPFVNHGFGHGRRVRSAYWSSKAERERRAAQPLLTQPVVRSQCRPLGERDDARFALPHECRSFARG